MSISRSELMHLRLQAIMKENNIPEEELKYIGLMNESHMYLIGGEHIVDVEDIVDVEEVT